MKIEELTQQTKRNFNNAVCLIGIIPFLAFLYLLAVRLGSFRMLTGETGLIMFAATFVSLTGITVGKKMLLALIQEVTEKDRLAAITETVLTLGHEINNPLMVIGGNLELLEEDFTQESDSTKVRNRIGQIKTNYERIREATNKMSTLSKPILTSIYRDTKVIDLNKSI